MGRILAIDADLDSNARLARALAPGGHRLLVATTAGEGVRLARAKRPGMILLGQRLPDRNGLEICKTLKGDPATERIPIVLILDHPDAIERAVAQELGVEECLVRPLAFGVLLARVEAALAAPSESATGSLQLGCLAVNPRGPREGRVSVEGRRVNLAPVELALLLVLCEGGERVHTRAELRERVWGEEGPDETRVVDQYVKRLRKKLGKAGAYVETVHGVGYRFAKGRAEREANAGE